MIEYFVRLDNYIPTECIKSVFDINYNKLYENGKKIILFDVDNTLVSYDMEFATDKIKELINNILSIGFKIVLVSNNKKERVEKFASSVNLPFVYYSLKPFTAGYRRALKMYNLKANEAVAIGDQMMTDIKASRKMKMDVIMVKCLKRSSEKWYTRLNRTIEKKIIKRIKKERPLSYQELLKVIGENYEN